MNLRNYQISAIDALNHSMREDDGNPCVVLPTGAGKSVVMAALIDQYLKAWPGTRICVVAHVRELVRQNADKLAKYWHDAPIGIYSAGLDRKDTDAPVIFASIQSIYNKTDVGQFDLIFIDEAHRIPASGEGMYRQFIASQPQARVVGFTATPYRLTTGWLCGPKNILHKIAYEAPIKQLIDEGYLCNLTTKGCEAHADTSTIAIQNGEYKPDALEDALLAGDLITRTVDELILRADNRKAILVFCATVKHAERVTEELSARGQSVAMVHGGTPKAERDAIVELFQAGDLRIICNVNVLSEGFDAQHVDCIAMLRPTQSPGLYYQQVGRGLRIHPNKANCLVLDFAENIMRHGPIDHIQVQNKRKRAEPGAAPVKKCPQCFAYFHTATTQCTECGYQWPAAEIAHYSRASELSILGLPRTEKYEVTDVMFRIHSKTGKPDSVRCDYYSGLNRVASRWLCFNHGGHATTKAMGWWYSNMDTPPPHAIDEVVDKLNEVKPMPTYIVVTHGKYPEIVDEITI